MDEKKTSQRQKGTTMKKFNIPEMPTFYKNVGQEAERRVRYALTGEIAKADNLAHNLGTDCLHYQIKGARASVCRGRDIEAYLAEDKATEFIYVTADLKSGYIMSKSEYIEFIKTFGTLTRESTKNGGHEKIRLKHESNEVREWLERA